MRNQTPQTGFTAGRPEGGDTRCGACFEPVIHGPEQCIVMQMYVQQNED